jgi:predicted AlkP superfamily pyrophosphatase or phosphodiesterase
MVKYTIVLDIVGLEYDHLESGLVPNISKIANMGESAKMEPVFPAVTCTVQASILSGAYPNQHGIISNGLYDRNNYTTSFWEQSNALVQTDRIWDIIKRNTSSSSSSIKTAVLFWQNTMYARSDIVMTPRPLHMDNGMVMWCYSKPVGYYEEIKQKLGEFNLASYWGPFASPKSSEWIVEAAEYTLEKKRPNLMLTYIPHLDYSVQRFGKNSCQVKEDLKKADDLVQKIIQKTAELGIKDDTRIIILSEYAFNDVNDAIPLNLKLRDAGLLVVRKINDKEYIDYEFSNAFAMVDHQIAHIYVKEGFMNQSKRVVENIEGIEKMLCGSEQKKRLNVDHERSGEIIAISDRDKWFSYYWWYEEEKAPNFARTVDIHRKPGYDPVELFIDPKTKMIPLSPTLIKASHGRPADAITEEGLALYVSSKKSSLLKNPAETAISCVKFGQHLINSIR